MRLIRDMSVAVMVLTFSVQAASETRTFPVTVSNAVSGKLETVPVTFRIGEDNGVIERFDGTRFVPVPVKGELAFPYMDQLKNGRERLAFLRRLQAIQLPEIRLPEMTISNAVELLADAIHRADASANAPVQLVYRDRRHLKATELPRIPATVIPATNALAALKIESFVAKSRPRPDPVPADPDPFAVAVPPNWDWTNYPSIRTYVLNRGVVIKADGGEDWCENWFTRAYDVPAIFSERFQSAEAFKQYSVAKSGLKNEAFEFVLMPVIGKIRVTYYDSDEAALFFDEYDGCTYYFEEKVLEPLFAEWFQSARIRGAPFRRGKDNTLLFRTSRGGYCLGFYRYCAEKDEAGVYREGLHPCPLFDDDDMSSLPCVFPVTVDHGLLRLNEAMDECWVLISNCGFVFRLEGDSFVAVPVESSPAPLVVAEDPTPRQKDRVMLSTIVLPEFAIKAGHITNGIAKIQAAIDRSPQPANRIRIVFNAERICAIDPSLAQVSAISVRSISTYDALNLLADITGLHLVVSSPETVEFVTENANTQRTSRVCTYRLPKPLCERLPTKAAWDAFLSSGNGLDVETYLPEQRLLAVRSTYGEENLVMADCAVECAYERFPGRFKLESRLKRGGPTLLLTDTYRNIVRRYRSGIGKDGKRWERFEVMK